jgi:hypothetical protein
MHENVNIHGPEPEWMPRGKRSQWIKFIKFPIGAGGKESHKIISSIEAGMCNATSAVCVGGNKIRRLWPIYVGIDGAQDTCYWRKTLQLLRFFGGRGARHVLVMAVLHRIKSAPTVIPSFLRWSRFVLNSIVQKKSKLHTYITSNVRVYM